ncbi:filamentous hemagglutinin N-terminal domain-containing protein, partial [Planktomarina temperata]|nr:filamentous hemagglutinin N-terminal domain-containing protein [Planktomarina temperata]
MLLLASLVLEKRSWRQRSDHDTKLAGGKRTSFFESVIKFSSHTLAWVGIAAVTIQPVFAQNIVASGPQGPSILATANGTPIVDINTPNTAGVSINTYGQFDVGPSGAILNNGTQNYVLTNLGGYVHGNANLQNGPASLIVNQVTGANASDLLGYIEVAENRADVVIVNPYGLTCDGCGFINTDHVMLSTGSPVYTGDAFKGVGVTQGNLVIGQKGADATGVSTFDLIARKIVFRGSVQGQRVRVIAGQNDVVFATGATSVRASDGTAAPDVAIDSTVLGGMYADKITILSTEKGVGARAPEKMSAGSGGMHITADGKLVIGRAVSQRHADIRGERLVVNKEIRSQDNLNINASEKFIIDADATIVSAAVANISAASSVQLGPKGQIYSADDLTVLAGGELKLGPETKILGARDVSIKVQSGDFAQGALVYAGLQDANGLFAISDLNLSFAQDFKAQSSVLHAAGRLDVQASHVTLDANGALPYSQISSGQDLNIVGSQLALNGASIVSQNTLKIKAAKGLTTSAGSILAASADLGLQANEITISAGQVESGSDLSLVASGTVQGSAAKIVAVGNMSVSGTDITFLNTDGYANNGALTITAKRDATLDGRFVSAKNLSISSTNDTILTGTFASHMASNVTANNLSVMGTLAGNTATLFAGGKLDVQGITVGISDVTLSATGDINLSGKLEAGKALRVVSGGSLTSTSNLVSKTNLALSAASILTSSGSFVSGGKVSFIAGGALTQRGAGAGNSGASAQELVLQGASVINSGNFSVVGNASLKALSGGALNSGVVLSGGVWDITTTGVFTNTGHLASSSNMTISAAGVVNPAVAILETAAEMSLQTGALGILHDGVLQANSDVVVNSAGSVHVAGRISSGVGNLFLTADEARITGSGSVVAMGNVTAHISRALDVAGDLGANGALSVTAGSYTQSGQVIGLTGASLTTTSGDMVLAPSAVVASKGAVALTAANQMTLAGQIQTGDTLSLAATGALTNAANLHATTGLALRTGSDLRNSGNLISGGEISAVAGSSLVNSGGFVAKGALTLVAGTALENLGDGLSFDWQNGVGSGDAASISFKGQTVKNSGNFASVSKVDLTAQNGTLSNTGHILANSTLTLASTNGDLLTEKANLIALGDLSITSNRTVTLSGSTKSSANIKVAGSSIETAAELVATGNLDLTAASGNLKSTGNIMAGRLLTLTASQDLSQLGRMISGGDIRLKAGDNLGQSGGLWARGVISMEAGNALATSGFGLAATGASAAALTLLGASVESQGGFAVSGDLTVTSTSGDVTQSGTYSAGGTVAVSSAALFQQTGSLFATKQLSAVAGSTINSGGLTSLEAMTITARAGKIVQSGVLQSNKSLTLNATETITQTASGQMIAAGGTLAMMGKSITLDGSSMASGDLNLTSLSGLTLVGNIYSDKSVDLNAQSVDLAGIISAQNGVVVNATQGDLVLRNTADIKSNGAQAFTASGNIMAANGSQVFAFADGLTLSSGRSATLDGSLLSNDDLDITAEQITHTGVIESVGALTLDATVGALVNSGTIAAGTASLQSATSFTNSGTLSANLTLTAGGAVQNSGTLQGSMLNLVQAARFENTATGKIETAGNQSYTSSGAWENAGKIITNSNIFVTATGTATNSGTIDAAETVWVEAGALNNQLGAKVEGKNVVLYAANLNNAGTILSENLLQIGLLDADGTTVKASTSLTNTGLIEAAGNITIQTAALTNSGIINGTGSQVSLTELTSFDNTNGNIHADGNLILQTGSALDLMSAAFGTVVADGTLALAGIGNGYLNAVTIAAGSEFTTKGGLHIKTAGLTVAGTLASETGNLVVQTNGNILNKGLIYAGGDWLMLRAKGTITNDGGALLAMSNMALCGEQTDNCLAALTTDRAAGIVNQNGGLIETFTGDMFLAAENIWNKSAISRTTTGQTVVSQTVAKVLHFFEPVGSTRWRHDDCCWYYVDHITRMISASQVTVSHTGPRSNIISGGNLVMNANTAENAYSTISASADISLDMNGLTNLGESGGTEYTTREGVARGVTENTYIYRYLEGRNKDIPWIARIINPEPRNGDDDYEWVLHRYLYHSDPWPDAASGEVGYFPPSSWQVVSSTMHISNQVLGSIVAGGTLTGTVTGTLTNGAVASGVGTLPTSGQGIPTLQATTDNLPATSVTASTVQSGSAPTGNGQVAGATLASAGPIATSVTGNLASNAGVNAGSVGAAAVSGVSVNGLVAQTTTPTAPTATTPPAVTPRINAVALVPTTGPQSAPVVNTSSFTNSSLFVINSAAPNGYLVETRPTFINLDQFTSSDYFLDLINFDTDETTIRFGDALVETRAIREQLIELSGSNLLDGNTSEADQIRTLYDNAAAAATDLQLTPGVALTADQVAALTDNIVWLEETEINGQSVLIPVVYLADGYEIVSGSSLQASNIALSVGSLENAGSLSSDDQLIIDAAQNIRNAGGAIASGGDLSLSADGNVQSLGGHISGENVQLVGQSVEIITQEIELEQGSLDVDPTVQLGQIASVSATGDLDIIAQEGGILLQGADVTAGGNMLLSSSGDIDITTAEKRRHVGASHYERLTSSQRGSSLIVGDNLNIISNSRDEDGNFEDVTNISILAADIKVGGAATILAATGNVSILAGENTEYEFLQTESDGFFSSTTVRTETLDVTYSETNIAAESISIAAAGTLYDQSTIYNAGADGLTYDAGKLVFDSVSDIHARTFYKKSSGFLGLFGSETNEKTLLSTALGGVRSSDGDIFATSRSDLDITGGRFAAAGNIHTQVTGDTNLRATVDTNFFSGTYNKNNGITITDTTIVDIAQTAGFPQFSDADGQIDFDPNSQVTLGLDAKQTRVGAMASSLLSPSSEGVQTMALLEHALPDATGPPNFDILTAALAPAGTDASEAPTSTSGGTSNPAHNYAGSMVNIGKPNAKDGAEYAYLNQLALNDLLTVEEMQLLQHSYFDKKTALNPAFQALLTTVIMPYAIGAMGLSLASAGSWVAAAQNAFINSVATGVVTGAITGDMDLGHILEGAVLQATTAGLTAGVTNAIMSTGPVSNLLSDLPSESLLGFSNNALSAQSLAQGTLSAAITAGAQTMVYGTDFGESFRTSLQRVAINESMVGVQGAIGDNLNRIDENGNEVAGFMGDEGSVLHTVSHAALGCVT